MSKDKKQTKFAAESAAEATAPSPAMLALFQSGGDVEKSYGKLERRNVPQMIKPSDVPVGQAITGEIVKIVPSMKSDIKGKLLWLRHESGQEFLFPCTGVIRNALIPGVEGEKDQTAALEKEVGKILVCKRGADRMSGKYKKPMFMFDVFTTEKAAKK
jgi:hypothetical protein